MWNPRCLLAAIVFAAFVVGQVRAGEARPTTAAQPPAKPTTNHNPAKATDAPGSDAYLPYEEPGEPESPSMGAVVARVIGSLALVVGLILVTMLILKRLLGGAKSPTTSRKVSELVEATPLGGKRFLYLIRVADRLLVVGAGGDRLVLLSEIKDPEVLARVEALPRRSDFFEMFRRTRLGSQSETPAKTTV